MVQSRVRALPGGKCSYCLNLTYVGNQVLPRARLSSAGEKRKNEVFLVLCLDVPFVNTGALVFQMCFRFISLKYL